MMHGRGKSDAAIVAGKPTNKAERSAAEPVEPRAVAKGNASQQSTQPGAAPGKRVTGAGAHTIRRESGVPVGPEAGAVCGKAACTDLCGGRSVMSVPTATHLDQDRLLLGSVGMLSAPNAFFCLPPQVRSIAH